MNVPFSVPLRRVFAIHILRFDPCGGRMRVLAAIDQPEVPRTLLDCLGLDSPHPSWPGSSLDQGASKPSPRSVGSREGAGVSGGAQEIEFTIPVSLFTQRDYLAIFSFFTFLGFAFFATGLIVFYLKPPSLASWSFPLFGASVAGSGFKPLFCLGLRTGIMSNPRANAAGYPWRLRVYWL